MVEKSDPSTTKNFFPSSLFCLLALSCQAIFFEIPCRAHNVIDLPGRLRKPSHLLATSKTSNHRALSHTTALVAANSVTPHVQISGSLNIFKAAMLLFLFLLVAGQASAEGGGQVQEIKNSKGETFSYKDRVAQEKEVFDIKDRFAIIY